jgi:hypothetical protein
MNVDYSRDETDVREGLLRCGNGARPGPERGVAG